MNGDTHCICCGAKLEGFYNNHHCTPQFEKAQERRNRLAEQDYINRQPTEAMRINSGFYLLSLGGDW